MPKSESSLDLSDLGFPLFYERQFQAVVSDGNGRWPGSGTLLDPFKETSKSQVDSSSFPQTFAQFAVDLSAAGYPFINWNTTSTVQQLGSPRDITIKTLYQYFGDGADFLDFNVTNSYRGTSANLIPDDNSKKADVFLFGGLPGVDNERLEKANYDVLFAVVPFNYSAENYTPFSLVGNVGGYRGYAVGSSLGKLAASNLAGIQVTTRPDGDDLILPSGPGSASVLLPSVVDRKSTLVNVGDGQDVVIGGFGRDVFGSYQSREYKNLLKKSEKGSYSQFSSPSRESAGSKLFVGGSFDDLLVSGANNDYVIGDRINGQEMYYQPGVYPGGLLPVDPITNSPISGFEPQIDNILRYRPEYFKAKDRFLASDKVYDNKPSWIPGNDKIFTFEGDDFVFGDDNAVVGASYGLKDLVTIREKIVNVNADDVAIGFFGPDEYKTQKLAADFIDAGPGADVIFSGVGGDAVIGGLGSDYIDLGPQVIAANYAPFAGTKVVYGDAIGSTQKSPDVFVVGDLLDTEDDIRNAKVVGVDTKEVGSSKSTLQNLVDIFNVAGKVVQLIPYKPLQAAVSGVGGILDVINAIFNSANPVPPQINTKAGAPGDALLVIKDFDAFDQLTLRVPDKGSINPVYKTQTFSRIDNPLVGSLTGGGTYLEVSGQLAGVKYDRVFLQGYRDGLVRLNPADDSGTFLFGGSDYLFRDSVTNELTFGGLLEGRDPSLPVVNL